VCLNGGVRVNRGLLIGVGITALSAGIGLTIGVPAGASAPTVTRPTVTQPTDSPGAGAQAVTYVVSAAAQRSALAFWTPRLMAAATAAVSLPSPAGVSADAPDALIAPQGTPTATKFSGLAAVGTLFYTTGSKEHFCTASVIDSAPGDIILTAAHCVYSSGYATKVAYVPEYHSGTRPLGTWAVRAITVAAGWRTTHDPNLDFAFLALAPLRDKHVQSVTGGLTLALHSSYAQAIEVVAYNDGDNDPVRCLTRSFEFRPGQQEFYCHDYRTGSSGGPWITGLNLRTGTGAVHGVIGGYEEGGDYEWASFSAYFGAQFAALFKEAAEAK
jgi:V8-like Glu-specific endopeptidase